MKKTMIYLCMLFVMFIASSCSSSDEEAVNSVTTFDDFAGTWELDYDWKNDKNDEESNRIRLIINPKTGFARFYPIEGPSRGIINNFRTSVMLNEDNTKLFFTKYLGAYRYEQEASFSIKPKKRLDLFLPGSNLRIDTYNYVSSDTDTDFGLKIEN